MALKEMFSLHLMAITSQKRNVTKANYISSNHQLVEANCNRCSQLMDAFSYEQLAEANCNRFPLSAPLLICKKKVSCIALLLLAN